MDPKTGQWRRKFNHELQDKSKMTKIYGFIRSQRIQWLGHVMRPIEDAVITLLYCSGSRKRKDQGVALDVVEKALKDLGVRN